MEDYVENEKMKKAKTQEKVEVIPMKHAPKLIEFVIYYRCLPEHIGENLNTALDALREQGEAEVMDVNVVVEVPE